MKNLGIRLVCSNCEFEFISGESDCLGFLKLDFAKGEISYNCTSCGYWNEMKMMSDQTVKQTRTFPKSGGF